jgi:hypothetical protein
MTKPPEDSANLLKYITLSHVQSASAHPVHLCGMHSAHPECTGLKSHDGGWRQGVRSKHVRRTTCLAAALHRAHEPAALRASVYDVLTRVVLCPLKIWLGKKIKRLGGLTRYLATIQPQETPRCPSRFS